MNSLQLEDLYTQKVIEQMHKIRNKTAPEIIHNYVEWQPEDSRRWYHIKTKVKYSALERKLPKYHQVNAWNKHFDSTNCDDIINLESTRKLTQAFKRTKVNSYYSYCETTNCYSCKTQKIADDEAKARKEATKKAEAEKKARIARCELEEQYWYLIPESQLQYYKPKK